MYRALELSAFDVSAQHCIMTGLLFKEVIGALVATLHCRVAHHQVQALIITSEVTAVLGNDVLLGALLPYSRRLSPVFSSCGSTIPTPLVLTWSS